MDIIKYDENEYVIGGTIVKYLIGGDGNVSMLLM